MYIYLWQIHVDVWQKPTQDWKAILQLKISKLFKKEKWEEIPELFTKVNIQNTTVQKHRFFSTQHSLWSSCHIHT